MLKRNLFSLLLVLYMGGCTKDDICSEDTATTPLLVIEFRDINDRLAAKAVQNLQIKVNSPDSTLVENAVNDTLVAIPLNTEMNSSSFLFTYNQNNENTRNTDVLTVNYTPEELYVNRACGFKVIYTQLTIAIENEPLNENWILDSEILNPLIENENEAHITIFH